MRTTETRRSARLARVLAASLVVGAAAAAGGCAAAGLRPLRALEGEFATKITEEELSERLDRFAELYAQAVVEGVRALAADETDPARQRAALVWQIQSVRTCRNAVLASDPQAAFTDVWVLCVQQREYLTSEEIARTFGPKVVPLAEAARRLEAEIQTIGAGFLADADLARARTDVEAFARAFPIRDGFARAAPLPSTADKSAANRLSWVTSVPMAPFRFVTGIDEGAAAIRHFSAVADRFARRVDSLPQETLWEAQLLLFDFEQRPTVQRTLASLESAARTGESIAVTAREFGATADRLGATLDTLPADLRKEVDATLEQLDARQRELRTTIDEVRKALADADAVVDSADAVVQHAQSAGQGFDATAKSVGEAAKSLEGAVRAYREMMLAVHPPKDGQEPKEPGAKPFDVMEWKQTADSIAAAAAELRGTLAEFRTTMTDDAVRERAGAAARAARDEAEAAIDHAFVRSLQLVGAIAVVVVVLRLVRPRRPAPPADAS